MSDSPSIGTAGYPPGTLRSSSPWPALAMAAGFLIAGYFYFLFDPSVPGYDGGRIVNLGLMADRQNGILLGMGIAVIGAILMAAQTVRSQR